MAQALPGIFPEEGGAGEREFMAPTDTLAHASHNTDSNTHSKHIEEMDGRLGVGGRGEERRMNG